MNIEQPHWEYVQRSKNKGPAIHFDFSSNLVHPWPAICVQSILGISIGNFCQYLMTLQYFHQQHKIVNTQKRKSSIGINRWLNSWSLSLRLLSFEASRTTMSLIASKHNNIIIAVNIYLLSRASDSWWELRVDCLFWPCFSSNTTYCKNMHTHTGQYKPEPTRHEHVAWSRKPMRCHLSHKISPAHGDIFTSTNRYIHSK